MYAFFSRFKKTDTNSNVIGKIAGLVFLAVAVVVVGAGLLWLVDRLFLLSISRSYIEQIAIVFNLNRHLAEAISLIVCVCLAACASLIFSISSRKRIVGILGIVCLLVANSLALWWGSKNQFFEASGNATKCYVMTRDGVTYGEREGIDLSTGRQCKKITPELVERLELYRQGKRPNRIESDAPAFFDPKTGEPTVWFARTNSGEIELFDLMGFHPETGEELQPVNAAVVQEWRKQEREIAERPPRPIDPNTFTFFDPKTGQVRAWFWHGADATWEFFDNKGFEPNTGEPLQPVTREVFNSWKAQASTIVARPPEKIDPNNYAFFDSRTGKPRVFYWHGSKGAWEFFNGPGYRPTGGEQLKPISQDVIDTWRRELAELKQQATESEAKAQRDRLAAQQAEADRQAAEAARQQALRQAEADRQSAESARLLALQQVGDNCDRMAANPTDSRRPSSVPGVEYSDLKGNAQAAADACAQAVKLHPEEPRYRYDWARALEFINPQQAINLYSELIKQNYVAAYDNYGGVIWRERKDLPAAIKLYETGVHLGDPSAMVSLAYLIKRNLYHVTDPIAARQALLTKAAQAGDKSAQDMLDRDQQEFQAQAIQQQTQQQQQQMMLNLFGAMARGMAR